MRSRLCSGCRLSPGSDPFLIRAVSSVAPLTDGTAGTRIMAAQRGITVLVPLDPFETTQEKPQKLRPTLVE